MFDLQDAAYEGDIARVKEFLAGGARIDDADAQGSTALSYALVWGHYALTYLLLAEGGPCIDHIAHSELTVWNLLRSGVARRRSQKIEETGANGLSALLKVMVMLDDAPPFFISSLAPPHAEICTRGQQFRAQLPSYLE
jgi:hypothetical protein